MGFMFMISLCMYVYVNICMCVHMCVYMYAHIEFISSFIFFLFIIFLVYFSCVFMHMSLYIRM